MDDSDIKLDKFIKKVLKSNIYKKQVFDNTIGDEIDKTDVQYLGNIITDKKQILKFVNTQNISGNRKLSPHGNSCLYVYNEKDEMLGYYYLGGFDGVPSKVKGTNLIFINKQSSCNQTTLIDFKSGIVKKFFVKCTKDKRGDGFMGDIWTFTKTKSSSAF